ncbi:RluA family pseudouridine synthase [Nitrincola alkalilacustris]|uniref:RluA family pseudouridine synthase n=1 Tax=Nitrincola alkalilacustris TaxID=1571224 RepID=UPI00124C9A40|nr:RluA family pseudouridine synthase [Nitrincola alkalilacustris]
MKISLKHTITAEEDGQDAATLLTQLSQLSKQRIKDAMNKGAVWLVQRQRKRLRRSTTIVRKGDILELYHDAELLQRTPPEGVQCLFQNKACSVWYKPAGIVAQGNNFSDHLSLMRIAEKQLNKPVFLVHRLDRETSGLMLLAHNRQGAASLSAQFRENKVKKCYRAIVIGETDEAGTIDLPLDGKSALTHFQRLQFDKDKGVSELSIRIETGRTHQIRRHFEMIGHPLMGDPNYGKHNKNRDGLQLEACELGFTCPVSNKPMLFSTNETAI